MHSAFLLNAASQTPVMFLTAFAQVHFSHARCGQIFERPGSQQ